METMSGEYFQLSSHKKDRESERLIERALGRSVHLQHVVANPRALRDIVRAMYDKKYQAKATVMKAGTPGDMLFVCAKGRLLLRDLARNVIRIIGPYDVFGEMSFVCSGMRKYTVTVDISCKLWILTQRDYGIILKKYFNFTDEDYVNYFRSIPIFEKFNYQNLLNIRNLATVECYPEKAKIIHEGEYGTKFFIITGGSVFVSVRDADGREKEIRRLKRGDFFGEGAPLHDGRRGATVTAHEPVECIVFDKFQFMNYLADLEPIRKAVSDRRIEVVDVLERNTEYNYIELDELEEKGIINTCYDGRVYLVEYKLDSRQEETFALKTLIKANIANKSLKKYIYNEKRILQQCRSPFIARLYKTFIDRKYVYFLHEACLGGDLKQLMEKVHQLDEKMTRFVAACVIEAFYYLHSRRILYNNLRTENLVFDEKGYVKLVGFSYAEQVGDTQEDDNKLLGDYSSLGSLIYEMIHGCPATSDPSHTVRNELNIQFKHHISKEAKSLIKKCWRRTVIVSEIRNERWFEAFEWDDLQKGIMKSPYKPKLQSRTDLCNFQEIRKDKETPPDDLSNWEGF
ncbi:UNVERIFIED_CONTAM: hypothetical protein PYX00_006184 [Menopon gallinae]|uniref:cGMP-dependent protein kinase n=1 Tax=Menopon gallinae TaxID=328185 RepID=A0AAW2HUB7_9NEOP